MPPQSQLSAPADGIVFVMEYDNGDTDYPVLAVIRNPNQGLGLTPPEQGNTSSYPGNTQYPATLEFTFTGVQVSAWAERVLWVYRKLPGPWSAYKETPADDGAIVQTRQRVNIGANIIAQDVLTGGVNTVTSAEPIDDYLAKEIQTARPIDGPPYILQTYSDRGDPVTKTIEYLNPTESPSESFGVDIERQAITLHQAKQVTTNTPVYGWIYDSLVDPQTGIVGNVAKSFVANLQSNQGGIFTGPETVNGMTFGYAGDLVVVEYQADTVNMQAILVTVFSLSQVEGISIGPFPIEGGYPIPPVLQSITPFADFATSDGTSTGTSNWEWHWRLSIEAEIGMSFLHYPEKLIGTETVTFSIGAPDISSLNVTQLFASSGDCVTRTWEEEANASAYSNDSASGSGGGVSQSFGYKVSHIPACLNGTVSIPATFGGGSLQGSGNIFKPDTTELPDTIVEIEVSEMKYNQLFELRVIKWTVPTPPA